MKTVKGLVDDLRTIRDKMNSELAKMTSEQRTKYFQKLRESYNSQHKEVPTR